MTYTYSDQLYSDLHKDATGVRPSQGEYVAWDKKTPDEKQAEWDHLIAELERSIQADKEHEERCIAAFESIVTKTIAAGAKDREEALDWIMKASDAGGDWEFYCYLNGLPYNYFNMKVNNV